MDDRRPVVDQLRHAGGVPEPLVVGKRLRWRRRDVEVWISKRKAG